MPRKPRMFQGGIPCHVIQRGNNRSVCFFSELDYSFYLECLAQACEKYDVDLHAYVLMTNHIHLLMTPNDETGISLVMHSIGRRYVQYINKELSRTGTLFEGRFKASLVDEDAYLLACMRYIELNPVRANMVNHPAEYKWSSYHVNTGLRQRKKLVAHPSYIALGENELKVCQKYKALFNSELASNVCQEITNAALFSMPLGDKKFKLAIEKALGRVIGYPQRGRPVSNK